jgi:hypothetical protein
MTITITKEERDALYERIVVRLNGLDDVNRVVEQGDWGEAQKLGQEFSDLLRFVCSDLGWGERGEETLSLSTPHDVLTRSAEAIRDLARCDVKQFESERQAAEELEKEAHYLQQACERILGDLQPR